MAKSKDMHSSSADRTPKLQRTAEQPSTAECWIPPKQDTPPPRAKKKPKQIVGEAKLCLESNPILTKNAWKTQTKPCPHQENPQRLN